MRRETQSCGCVIEWETEAPTFRHGTVISRCAACVAATKQDAKKAEEYKLYTRTHLESLTCEECGAHLGWAYENDLNGSHFFCNPCKEKFNAT